MKLDAFGDDLLEEAARQVAETLGAALGGTVPAEADPDAAAPVVVKAGPG